MPSIRTRGAALARRVVAPRREISVLETGFPSGELTVSPGTLPLINSAAF